MKGGIIKNTSSDAETCELSGKDRGLGDIDMGECSSSGVTGMNSVLHLCSGPGNSEIDIGE